MYLYMIQHIIQLLDVFGIVESLKHKIAKNL